MLVSKSLGVYICTCRCQPMWPKFTYSKTLSFRHLHSITKAKSHYEVLNLTPAASQEEIRNQFLKLSKKHHPDVSHNSSKSHHEFIRISEAYSVLGRPASKREYDVSLAARYHAHISHVDNINSFRSHDSHGPGTAPMNHTYSGDGKERVFWDESLWHMRDKSKDYNRFYPEDSYYGIKGVKKMSNSVIVIGCFFLLVLGTIIHMMAIWYSRNVSLQILDEKDKIINDHLLKVRERAKNLGNAKQLEILKEKLANLQSDTKPPP